MVFSFKKTFTLGNTAKSKDIEDLSIVCLQYRSQPEFDVCYVISNGNHQGADETGWSYPRNTDSANVEHISSSLKYPLSGNHTSSLQSDDEINQSIPDINQAYVLSETLNRIKATFSEDDTPPTREDIKDYTKLKRTITEETKEKANAENDDNKKMVKTKGILKHRQVPDIIIEQDSNSFEEKENLSSTQITISKGEESQHLMFNENINVPGKNYTGTITENLVVNSTQQNEVPHDEENSLYEGTYSSHAASIFFSEEEPVPEERVQKMGVYSDEEESTHHQTSA